MAAPPPVTRSRTFARLVAASLAGPLSTGVVTPVLPRYARALEADATLVGLVVALAPICSVLGSVLAGPFVDARGRRTVALAGITVATAGALLLLAAPAGIAATLLSRGTLGFGAGVAAAAIITWIVDTAPPERRGRAIGVTGLAVWIGLAAGPQLGQALLDGLGYSAVWAAIAAIEALAFALLLGGRDARRASAPAPRGRGLLRGLVPRGAIEPSAGIALAAYGEGVLMAFLVLHLVERGVADGAGLGGAASVFTIFASAVLVFRLPTSWLLDRVGSRPVVKVALGLEAAALAVLALSSSFAVAAAGAAVMGVAFSALFPGLAVLAAEATPADQRGAALGTFGASFSLGVALGSLLGGVVAAAGGTGAAHLSGAVAAALAVVLLARMPPAGREEVNRPGHVDPEWV